MHLVHVISVSIWHYQYFLFHFFYSFEILSTLQCFTWLGIRMLLVASKASTASTAKRLSSLAYQPRNNKSQVSLRSVKYSVSLHLSKDYFVFAKTPSISQPRVVVLPQVYRTIWQWQNQLIALSLSFRIDKIYTYIICGPCV